MSNTKTAVVSREWNDSERADLSAVLKDEADRLLSELGKLRNDPTKEVVYEHTYIRWFQVATFRGDLRTANVRYLNANRHAFQSFIST